MQNHIVGLQIARYCKFVGKTIATFKPKQSICKCATVQTLQWNKSASKQMNWIVWRCGSQTTWRWLIYLKPANRLLLFGKISKLTNIFNSTWDTTNKQIHKNKVMVFMPPTSHVKKANSSCNLMLAFIISLFTRQKCLQNKHLEETLQQVETSKNTPWN